mgnify:FL=1
MIAYTEVDEVLNLMDKEFQRKIPEKLRKLISKNKLKDYNVVINPDIPLNKQNISRKALAMLAVLNYNYWCTEEKKKKDLIEKYKNNEIIEQEKLKEIYNPDKIFTKKIKMTEEFQDKQLIIYNKKESIINKIINKIRKILKLT